MKNCFCCLLLFIGFYSKAQDLEPRYQGKEVFPFGVIERLESKALDETRTLNIYLPQGYHPDSTQTYPVIYVLDGSQNEDFPHIAGLVQFMNMYNLMPKSIVVGIANVDRYRDFTYPSTDDLDLRDLPTGGGSPRFIQFVSEELQPFIEANYKVNSDKTIIGQSLGGLLATEILMKKPDLFDDYIIVSPSLWWDKEQMIGKAASYFKTHQELEKRIFVSLGKEHPTMHKVAEELVSAIKNSGNDKLEYYFQPILEEDHATILHKAAYQAFTAFNPKETE
ncbi:alpha/beta hydrolase [Fulvivirga ligni]|uniref:alpha/beta hydrolase n=1 Tax=Fulvivirga ligni TaxID=2904246 RepID=UPI001EEC4AC5|nr:alpha/beta hydrolase-fold protein [Fulvivirga ligni]UII20936.1 alpha/beta hydrolase [Fulvivirga ligni]